MPLNDYIQVMRPAIEEALQNFVAKIIPADYPELRAMLTYHMGWEGEGAGPEAQGKRVRPLLVLLCASAANSREDAWRTALPAAAAVELLHNFSLIHDDIQDQSELRRNRKAVWVKWGMPQAINAGDLVFTLAFRALQDLTLPAQEVLLANRILQDTCLRLIQGQYLDMAYESRQALPLQAYWPMVGGKTSALLACCCELGALAGGADETRRAQFREYGDSLGLAFQVLDDWLGIWGSAAETGKSVESDLVSGKKSLPVLYALSKNGSFARRWLEGPVTPEEVPALAEMLEAEGAKTYTLETAARLTSQAKKNLSSAVSDAADCEGSPAQALNELTQALLERRK